MEPIAPIDIENRGRHWESKEDKPQVWKSTQVWSHEYQKLELRVHATQKLKTFPWRNPIRQIGNQAKCIWMHLFLSEVEDKSIRIDWADTLDEDTSFFRIRGFTVLDAGQFNGGLFPLPSGWSSKNAAQPHLKLKTLIHNWHAVGLHEGPDAGTMRYYPQKRQAIKAQRIRMGIKRSVKTPTDAKKPADAQTSASPTAPPFTAAPMLIAQDAPPSLAPLLNPAPPTQAVPLIPNPAPTKAVPLIPSPLEMLSRVAAEKAALAAAHNAVERAHADRSIAEHDHKAAATKLLAAQAHLRTAEHAHKAANAKLLAAQAHLNDLLRGAQSLPLH